MDGSIGSLSIGAFLCGVALHRFYFIKGEHHMESPTWAMCALVAPIALGHLLHIFSSWGWLYSMCGGFLLAASTFVGLMSIILLYRVLGHRLREFPGPFWAKTTKFYQVYQCRHQNQFQWRCDLHETYGPFVRIGPSEISCIHPDGVAAIHGLTSHCTKSPWYDQGRPTESLQTIRDSKVHSKRRKIWDLGFSSKALRDFEPRQLIHIRRLGNQLSKRDGQVTNVSRWFSFLTFDIMEDLAFGNTFSMLESGEQHYAMKLLHNGQKQLALLTPVPWLTRILTNIPGAMSGRNHLKEWCLKQVNQRKETEPANADIMSHLLEDAETRAPDDAQNWLTGDARLIIVAGSDTTSTTLIHVFYHLCKQKDMLDKLRSILDSLNLSADDLIHHDVQNIPYLDGIINETLRLHPPVPSGLLRTTPPEGITCDGIFIPGDTTISVPLYVIGRSELAYKQPCEFIPERWNERQDLTVDKNAFAPFSSGKYSCVGKNLTMMELRTTIAYLVLKFDFAFASDEDGSKLFEDALDAFTIFPGDLNIVFRSRQVEEF